MATTTKTATKAKAAAKSEVPAEPEAETEAADAPKAKAKAKAKPKSRKVSRRKTPKVSPAHAAMAAFLRPIYDRLKATASMMRSDTYRGSQFESDDQRLSALLELSRDLANFVKARRAEAAAEQAEAEAA